MIVNWDDQDTVPSRYYEQDPQPEESKFQEWYESLFAVDEEFEALLRWCEDNSQWLDYWEEEASKLCIDF